MPIEWNYFYEKAADRKGGNEELEALIEQNFYFLLRFIERILAGSYLLDTAFKMIQ